MGDQPVPDGIIDLSFAFFGSKALLSAVELGLFTELADGPLDAETLRQRLGLHPRASRDFFDALFGLGLLEREDGRYRNTAETDLFLDRAKPSYQGGLLEMMNARLYGFWNDLTEGLRTGTPQNEAKTGGNLFEALYADPDRLRGFARAMTASSIGPAMAIAATFPWDRYQSVIDIGCAEGCVPVQVARAHPHLGGGGFDLPAIEPLFDEYVGAAGLSDRLRFHPGDFFADELPQADVLVMGRILHDWNLDEKRALLEKAYKTLPAGGALIVYDGLIDDDRRENALGLLFSLLMLIELPGGALYTGADCRAWMAEAGFTQTTVAHLAGHDAMVVGFK